MEAKSSNTHKQNSSQQFLIVYSKQDTFTSSVQQLNRKLPIPPALFFPPEIQSKKAHLLDESEMIVLDSFLKFSNQNEELRLVKKFENLYRTRFMSESRRSIWSLLLLEFRRFVLDFAETKKHEDLKNLT